MDKDLLLFLEAPELQREHRNVICAPQAPETEKHILCLIPVNFPHLHEITIFSLFFTFIGVILKYVNNVFLSTFTAGNVLHIKLRSQSNIFFAGVPSMENKLDIEYYTLLAERIRNHDTEAFTEFYYATYKDLYRYACYFLKDVHLAQDALHEIYILIWRSISSLKENRLFYPWAKQIAYHVCCDFQKKSQLVASHETSVNDDTEFLLNLTEQNDCFQGIWDKDFQERMDRYLDELPSSMRQAFLLRYENNLKLEEIADFLGVSLSTVKRAINKVRKYLQKKFTC